jgi:hypothetical protein
MSVELILLYILVCGDFILNFRVRDLLHLCVYIKYTCYSIQYSLVVIGNEATAA